MKIKTKENRNKVSKPLAVLAAILTVLLVLSLIVTILNKSKIVYISVPSEANKDFGGTMLSDYDNLTLNFYDNKIEFDFSDVSIDDYDFIVLDICDARLLPSDSGSVLKYGPSFDNTGVTNGIQNQLSMSAASITYGEFFGEYDMHNSSDFTYLIDARSLASGVVEVLTYLDGVYCHKTVFEDITDITLKNFVINYHSIDKTYGNFSINAMYLYGFKNAEDCSLGAYISDTTLKLSDCKDSLLYTGE